MKIKFPFSRSILLSHVTCDGGIFFLLFARYCWLQSFECSIRCSSYFGFFRRLRKPPTGLKSKSLFRFLKHDKNVRDFNLFKKKKIELKQIKTRDSFFPDNT